MKHIKEYEEFEFNNNLNEGLLGDIWERFKALIKKLFTSSPEPSKPKPLIIPPQLEGQHMLYLPHQQGPSGTAEIIKAARGNIDLSNDLRFKLLKNMPSSDPGYIKVKTGKGKEAALAFLNYQKNTWNGYAAEAKSKISEQSNLPVKNAIEKIQNRKFPIDFLNTVAYKESRFNPDPKGNPSYVGLFQIGDSAWKQLKSINPTIYKGPKPPKDIKLNAQAGHDYLMWAYDQFSKKMN